MGDSSQFGKLDLTTQPVGSSTGWRVSCSGGSRVGGCSRQLSWSLFPGSWVCLNMACNSSYYLHMLVGVRGGGGIGCESGGFLGLPEAVLGCSLS